MLSLEARAKRDKLFEVGDMVTIRSIDDMVKEYGLSPVISSNPDVLFGFPVDDGKGMDQYCGKTFKIMHKTKDSEGYLYKLDYLTYCFSSDMFELPNKKKSKTTKKETKKTETKKIKAYVKTNSSAILDDLRKSLIELREKINKIIGE